MNVALLVGKDLRFLIMLIKVQMRFRRKRNIRLFAARRKASAVIGRFLMPKMTTIANRVRGRKVDIIRTFFAEHSHIGDFAKIMKNFRYRVLKCQWWYREFKKCSVARLEGLSVLWERMVQEAEGYDPDLVIPIATRNSILFQYLRMRRWGYRRDLIEYILRVQGKNFLFSAVTKDLAKEFLKGHVVEMFPMSVTRETKAEPKENSQDVFIPQLLQVWKT